MADEQITRVMPFDAEAEMSVIGSMLMDEKWMKRRSATRWNT